MSAFAAHLRDEAEVLCGVGDPLSTPLPFAPAADLVDQLDAEPPASDYELE